MFEMSMSDEVGQLWELGCTVYTLLFAGILNFLRSLQLQYRVLCMRFVSQNHIKCQ